MEDDRVRLYHQWKGIKAECFGLFLKKIIDTVSEQWYIKEDDTVSE